MKTLPTHLLHVQDLMSARNDLQKRTETYRRELGGNTGSARTMPDVMGVAAWFS
jgi:hypothetical protein